MNLIFFDMGLKKKRGWVGGVGLFQNTKEVYVSEVGPLEQPPPPFNEKKTTSV